MNGCKATTLFGIKSVVQENPYILMSILFISSALVSAYAMQVFERKNEPKFNLFWNSLWCIIVTMATVGYGDMYPITFGGRVTGICVMIWGIFLASYFTVTLTNYLTF
jgi:voltage-gated potassium channel